MSSSDFKNVSTVNIEEGINYLKNQFIGNLDECVNEIVNQYSGLFRGVLSSNNIDALVGGIKTEINKLQSSFDEIAAKYVTTMSTSAETIAQSTSNIESTLSRG